MPVNIVLTAQFPLGAHKARVSHTAPRYTKVLLIFILFFEIIAVIKICVFNPPSEVFNFRNTFIGAAMFLVYRFTKSIFQRNVSHTLAQIWNFLKM